MAFKSEAQRRWFFANMGNSGSGSPKGSSKKYKPGTDPVKTLVKQDKRAMTKAVIEGKKEIAKDKIDLKNIKKYSKVKTTSRDKYYNEKTKKYNPERNKLHQELLIKVDNQNAFPNKEDKPKVIFIGGLTASGKSSVIAPLIDRKEGLPDYKAYPKFVYLNSDNFKGWLPEYKGYNANQVHEESSDIFEKGVKKYRNQGKQIIIDSTLKNAKKSNKKIQEFKKAGYEVILYGTNIPGEKSIKRATARFKKNKRYVPLELIKKNAEQTNKSVLKLRHKADKYKVMNTDVPLGEPPKLIESNISLKQDREQTADIVVDTEEEWRDIGIDKSDLKGYDTKKHKKVKTRIR